MTCEPTLSERQARLVRELARTPGNPVHWSILADAIGAPTNSQGQHRTQAMIQNIRGKFGHDIIRSAGSGNAALGYYLPADWNKR